MKGLLNKTVKEKKVPVRLLVSEKTALEYSEALARVGREGFTLDPDGVLHSLTKHINSRLDKHKEHKED